MAQGVLASASLPLNGAGTTSTLPLTAEELREILEYDRIVQFRDAVLAGTHPRVRIPPHLVGKPVVPTLGVLPATQNIEPRQVQPTSSSKTENKSTTLHPGTNLSKSEINPILLEKSDDLIKAEIQLQRQRLERALRDQIEQQRIATRAALQTFESLPDFDLSEVLSKALAIVQSSTIDAPAFVGTRSNASDSFDDATFYSSQHDTPESNSSQGQRELNGKQSQTAVSPSRQRHEHRSAVSTRSHSGDGDVVIPTTPHLINDSAAARGVRDATRIPFSGQPYTGPPQQEQQPGRSDTSNSRGAGTVPGVPGGVVQSSTKSNLSPPIPASLQHMETQSVVQRTTHDSMNEVAVDSRPSPLIRAHNLSPFAPQPARVSPLATARDAPVLRDNRQTDGAPPAQVAALRHVASGLSSTDSSPKAGKVSERKKKKDKREKKRKAKENGPASPDSPYIKPEPQSPEPFAVAPLPRPHKRQRQSGQFASGLTYDEPEEIQSRSEPRRIARVPQAFQHEEDRYEVVRSRREPVYERVDDGYVISEPQYLPRPRTALQYQPVEARPIRTESVMEHRIIDQPRYSQVQPQRASIRSNVDHGRSQSPIPTERQSSVLMAPPRKPMRIVLDEFGNEYLEPVPMTASRQSMAPPTRYREPEVVYDRAPMRAVSARIPHDAYEENGVIYRRASPPVARRVVTQPEYGGMQADFRPYRQREYSSRPSGPGEEFVQIRGPERRPIQYYEEPMRERTVAPTMRPETTRYEIPREHLGRVQSVRPEGSVREYATSMNHEPARDYVPTRREYSVRPEAQTVEYGYDGRPEVRREVVPQGYREYSVRPGEMAQRREYAPVQGEGYYEERRPAQEIAFIERPRAREASVIVYTDDGRREMYR